MTAYHGIPVTPSQGSKRARYPDVRVVATFFTQGSVLASGISPSQSIVAQAIASESNTGRATSDIISGGTFKSIANPVGTWNLSLVPRKSYLTQITPGDWCEIQGDNGDGLGMRVMCYGPVKSVDLVRTVADKGTTRTYVQISGADFGEVLVKTSALYDAQLASDPGISSIAFSSIATTTGGLPDTPGGIVRGLLQHYLGRNIRQLVNPRTAQPFAQDLSLDYVDDVGTLGKTFPTSVNPSTSLWQLLQQYANLGVNELFADYRPPLGQSDQITQLQPSVVLRQCPFWGRDWEALPTLSLDSDEVSELQLGKSDNDVRNWIRALDEGDTRQFLSNEHIGTVNPESIDRFGFRRYENSTIFAYPVTATQNSPTPTLVPGIADILKAQSALQTLWHHSNEKLYNGSMVLCFRPEVRVGYRVFYMERDTATQYAFYCEAVGHTFGYPGPSSTHLTLTRGRDVADPLWRKSLAELKAEGIVEELGNTVSATFGQAIKGLST